MAKIGILAGNGSLPLRAARAISESDEVFVIAYKGDAEETVKEFPHAEFSLLQINSIVKRLRKEDCKKLVIIGGVSRPAASFEAAPDGFLADIPTELFALVQEETNKQGQNSDDAMMTAFVRYLEEVAGFEIVGVETLCPQLTLTGGLNIGKVRPQDKGDVKLALRTVETLGDLSIGQSAVVCRGIVLAVEAAEGTNKMLGRIHNLPRALRGSKTDRAGVFIKLPRRHQDMRIDLPTIGVDTIMHIIEAGLAGIVVEEGHILIDGRREVIRHAQAAGIFIRVIKPR